MRSRIALSLIVTGAFVMGSALSAFEQSEPLFLDFADASQYIHDDNMANAPPGFDQVFALSSIEKSSQKCKATTHKFTRGSLVDTILLVYTGASTPNQALFASLMTDMGTNVGFYYECSTAGNRHEIAIPNSALVVGKEVQAEAESIAMTSFNLNLILGPNAEKDVLGYPSGYL